MTKRKRNFPVLAFGTLLLIVGFLMGIVGIGAGLLGAILGTILVFAGASRIWI